VASTKRIRPEGTVDSVVPSGRNILPATVAERPPTIACISTPGKCPQICPLSPIAEGRMGFLQALPVCFIPNQSIRVKPRCVKKLTGVRGWNISPEYIGTRCDNGPNRCPFSGGKIGRHGQGNHGGSHIGYRHIHRVFRIVNQRQIIICEHTPAHCQQQRHRRHPFARNQILQPPPFHDCSLCQP